MMRTIVRRSCGPALVAALVLGVSAPAALAGTGGKQLTKKQWIKAANAICDDTDEKIDSLTLPTADPTSATPLTDEEFAEIEDYVQPAYDYSKDAHADLKALKPPKKDAAKVKRILTTLKDGVDAIGDALRATKRGDQEAVVTALEESQELGGDFEAAAKAYGSTCGASGSA